MKKRRLFRVMKLIARQENTSWQGAGGAAPPSSVPNTSAYRGFYKLEFPDEWDIQAPTYCCVEQATIAGIPIDLATGDQLPRSYSIRSNALSGAGNIEEAKRWRRNITTPAGAVSPYGLNPNNPKDPNIETATSNLLATIPNPMSLNFGYAAWRNTQATSANYNTGHCYKIIWENDAELTTCGVRVPLTSAQTMVDIYITANYDFPQMNVGGTAMETKLKLVQFFDEQPLQQCGQVGGGWDLTIVFYQLADTNEEKNK